jgi:hypothetical protein
MKWPKAIQQFWWDLPPAKLAPENSGIPAPDYVLPEWLSDEGAATEEAAEYAQRTHDHASDRADKAESKASRLAQTSLALLTATLALAGFQLNICRRIGGGWRYLLVAPATLALGFLILAGIGSLEIDRVGIYSPGTVEEIATADNQTLARTRAEERARWHADATATQKFTSLLQARAWLSRSLVCLFIAGVVATVSQALPRQKQDPSQGRGQRQPRLRQGQQRLSLVNCLYVAPSDRPAADNEGIHPPSFPRAQAGASIAKPGRRCTAGWLPSRGRSPAGGSTASATVVLVYVPRSAWRSSASSTR